MMEEAIAAGKAFAVINSNFVPDGTESLRLMYLNGMTPKTVLQGRSGVNVILGGVKPTTCLKAPLASLAKGYPTDGRNLIEEAEEMGYR